MDSKDNSFAIEAAKIRQNADYLDKELKDAAVILDTKQYDIAQKLIASEIGRKNSSGERMNDEQLPNLPVSEFQAKIFQTATLIIGIKNKETIDIMERLGEKITYIPDSKPAIPYLDSVTRSSSDKDKFIAEFKQVSEFEKKAMEAGDDFNRAKNKLISAREEEKKFSNEETKSLIVSEYSRASSTRMDDNELYKFRENIYTTARNITMLPGEDTINIMNKLEKEHQLSSPGKLYADFAIMQSKTFATNIFNSMNNPNLPPEKMVLAANAIAANVLEPKITGKMTDGAMQLNKDGNTDLNKVDGVYSSSKAAAEYIASEKHIRAGYINMFNEAITDPAKQKSFEKSLNERMDKLLVDVKTQKEKIEKKIVPVLDKLEKLTPEEIKAREHRQQKTEERRQSLQKTNPLQKQVAISNIKEKFTKSDPTQKKPIGRSEPLEEKRSNSASDVPQKDRKPLQRSFAIKIQSPLKEADISLAKLEKEAKGKEPAKVTPELNAIIDEHLAKQAEGLRPKSMEIKAPEPEKASNDAPSRKKLTHADRDGGSKIQNISPDKTPPTTPRGGVGKDKGIGS